VHVRVNGLGLPTKFLLTPGQTADVTQGEALVAGTAAAVVIADKGYDSAAVVRAVEATGAEAVIPTQKNRKVQRDIDRERYKDRNLVERFWGRVKQYRRVATRYEKTARNFLAFVHVASIMILLR
jgi:transposase